MTEETQLSEVKLRVAGGEGAGAGVTGGGAWRRALDSVSAAVLED